MIAIRDFYRGNDNRKNKISTVLFWLYNSYFYIL